ncbi:MAG: hypothetical protein ABIE74_10630 [Pseudomonadota bacterium]
MKKQISLTIILLMIAACGMPGVADFESLLDHQPKVIKILPDKGEELSAVSKVEVFFSQPVKSSSINEESFIVSVAPAGGDEASITKDMQAGNLKGVDGEFEVDAEGKVATFYFSDDGKDVKMYAVLINDLVVNELNVPLNQNRGKSPEPFFSYFYTGKSLEVIEGSKNPVSGGSPSGGGLNPAEKKERIDPEKVAINEVYYDAVGKDTDGDLFIELSGTPEGDISEFVINLVDGDGGLIKDTIKIPEDSYIPDDGIYLIADSITGQTGSRVEGSDFIDNFDPQNGPDAVQLIGRDGSLWDAMSYGDVSVTTAENGLAIFEGDATPLVNNGQSLSRRGGIDTDDNLSDFEVLDVPTPGEL